MSKEMSNKLVHYRDVCDAMIPILADMLQKGDAEPAIRVLKALGTLEDVDLVREVRERCSKHGDDCQGCEFCDCHDIGGCFWQDNDNAPEDWTP